MRAWMSFFFIVAVFPAAGIAQQHEHAASPYADLTDRDIKALSSQEVEQYLSGEGMGFALAAELNGYPGPRHVLELAHGLNLSEPQISAVETLQASMLNEAIRLGNEIVEQERLLDRAFADATIDEQALAERTERVGLLRGRLRNVHLRAHLAVTDVLTPEQVERYQELRGYSSGAAQ